MANYKYTTELKIGLSSQEKTDIANAIEDKVVARVGSQPVAFLTLQEIESLDRNIGLVVKKELKPEPNPNGEYTTENIYRWNDESASYEDTGIIYSRTLLDKNDPILLDIRNDFKVADDGLQEQINTINEHQDLQDLRLKNHDKEIAYLNDLAHQTTIVEVKEDFKGQKFTIPETIKIEGNPNRYSVIDNQLFKVGGLKGNTKASKNKMPFPYVSGEVTQENFTLRIDKDGRITLNGKPNDWIYFTIWEGKMYLPEFTLSGCKTGTGGTYFLHIKRNGDTIAYAQTNEPVTIPAGEIEGIYLRAVDIQYDNVIVEPMIEFGKGDGKFEPTYNGLRDATIRKITSIGANRIPFPYHSGDINQNGKFTLKVNSDGSITLNGTTQEWVYFYFLSANEKPIELLEDAMLSGLDDGYGNTYFLHVGVIGDELKYSSTNKPIMIPKGIYNFIGFRCVSGITFNNKTIKPMLNIGGTTKEFVKYAKYSTIEIPRDGLVLKGAKEAYDEAILTRTPNTDLFEVDVKRKMKTIDLGSLEWLVREGGSGQFPTFVNTPPIADMKKVLNNQFANAVCSKYNIQRSDDSILYGKIGLGFNQGTMYIHDPSYKTAEEFKAAMNGVLLTYELAEETQEPKISNLTLDDVTVLGVQGGQIEIEPTSEISVEPTATTMVFDVKYWEKGGNL